MPQLEKTTFLLQYLYLIIFFLMFYISLEQLILPNLYKVFKVRILLKKELKDDFLNIIKKNHKIQIIKNKLNIFSIKLKLLTFSTLYNKLINNYFNINSILYINNNIIKNYLYKNLYTPYQFIKIILATTIKSENIFFKKLEINQKLLNYISAVFFNYNYLLKNKKIPDLHEAMEQYKKEEDAKFFKFFGKNELNTPKLYDSEFFCENNCDDDKFIYYHAIY